MAISKLSMIMEGRRRQYFSDSPPLQGHLFVLGCPPGDGQARFLSELSKGSREVAAPILLDEGDDVSSDTATEAKETVGLRVYRQARNPVPMKGADGLMSFAGN